MELSPNTPRQRNRRTDRAAAQQEQSPVMEPLQPVVQRVQTDYPQQDIPGVMRPAPQRTMYQPPEEPRQPVRPTSYPRQQSMQVQNGYVQPVKPPVQHTAPLPVMRPKSLPQTQPRNTGWQQPTLREDDAPRARAAGDLGREHARSNLPREEKKKLPGWLTTLVSLAIILVLALGAAYWLMEAYLTTQENARIAAYQRVLDNYHVTESADGSLRVTWQDEIEYYAAQYNLQPAFVMAIIRNESSFRTNAESNVGARGLMQMMPDTAEWIAGKLDDDSYTFDRMWDGETNIRYGCWYLGYLTRLFRGDAELVSGAFHAGQTTITQWLSDPKKSSDGVTLDLDKLSDGPTKQYIGRVTQAYGIYQSLLYPDAAFGAADDVSAGSHGAAAADR